MQSAEMLRIVPFHVNKLRTSLPKRTGTCLPVSPAMCRSRQIRTSPTNRSFPQKVWDTAWGVGESAVDTTVDSVGTLGDSPVHDAAVDPFGFNRGQRAQPSPEHSPAEIAAAAANIVSLIPIVGTGGRVGGAAVQEAVEAVLRRGGTAADAEAAAPSDPTIPVGDRPASTPVGGRGDREINVKPGTNRPGIVNGREYTGHAFDRMQERGILPSLVEQAIREGLATPSRGNTTSCDHLIWQFIGKVKNMTDQSIYRLEAEQVNRDYCDGKISLHALVEIFERYVRERESERASDSETLRGAWGQIEIMNAINQDDPSNSSKNESEDSQADGSDVFAFEGGHPFALITDHDYLAYRIPVEHDHILMIPGKTDYLYSSAGVRMPAWRVTLSSEQKKLLSVFESARDVVSDELDVMEQSDRHGNAA
eukprot:gene25348-30425_t